MKNQKCISVDYLKLFIVLDDDFVYGIHWTKQDIKSYKLTHKQNKLISILSSELTAYLAGQLKKFTTPIKLIGTDFQIKVWSKLQSIPYARLITYKKLATQIGNSNASRAVGTANSKNPISIIVPCHRVIRSGGEYGGYAGGDKIKRQLIESELGLSEFTL